MWVLEQYPLGRLQKYYNFTEKSDLGSSLGLEEATESRSSRWGKLVHKGSVFLKMHEDATDQIGEQFSGIEPSISNAVLVQSLKQAHEVSIAISSIKLESIFQKEKTHNSQTGLSYLSTLDFTLYLAGNEIQGDMKINVQEKVVK